MGRDILHVMRTYGVHGGERQLFQLFSANAGTPWRETFLSVYQDDAAARYFARIEGLRLGALLPMSVPAFPSLAIEVLILLLLSPVLQLRVLWEAWRRGAGVCFAHGLQGAVSCWLAACLLRRVPFVYVHRGTKSAAGSSGLFRWLYAPFRVVAGVSEASARSLDPLLAGRRAIALTNGIDWQGIQARAGARPAVPERTLLAIGRLMPGKGQRLLLDAFALLSNAAWRLCFAGSGPDEATLRQQAEALGIAGRVDFLGHVEDVAQCLVVSGIFVHASESEGLSNAVLEAMALRVPSVVVDAAGVSECHVAGETGLVVPRDANALAAALDELIDNPLRRHQMGQAAEARVRSHFSIDANAARYRALYSELVEG